MSVGSGTGGGKVILFGEHAVVHGIPAIAVGIGRGARATATARDAGPSSLHIAAWNVDVREDDPETPLARALRDLLAATRAAGVDVPAVRVDAVADLPPGGGLGCSAALGVAVARALDTDASAEALAPRVAAWEQVFHGNPSGVDAAVATLGGCVLFQRDPATGRRTIERVRVPHPIHVCVGDTGQASSTLSMVESVARLHRRRPEVTQKSFDAIHTLVKNARLAIEAGDRVAVGQLLDLNQMLLSGLFVSTPEIEQLCAAARANGAHGAKLTGAGGGGCVVALVDGAEGAARVLSAWQADGFKGFSTTFGSVDAMRAAPPAVFESAP